MAPGKDPHQPDWHYYVKHKQSIDDDATRLLEAGTLQKFGHPDVPQLLEITAKSLCTILHKNPGLITGSVGPTGKPLTASEKRKQRRFEKNRQPDEIIEKELKEGEGFRIIPNEDYIQPKPSKYLKKDKDGNEVEMPDDWLPIKLEDTVEVKSSPQLESNKEWDKSNIIIST